MRPRFSKQQTGRGAVRTERPPEQQMGGTYMQHFSGPLQSARCAGRCARMILPAMLAAAAIAQAGAQMPDFHSRFDRMHPFITHSSSQGYLGGRTAKGYLDSFMR